MGILHNDKIEELATELETKKLEREEKEKKKVKITPKDKVHNNSEKSIFDIINSNGDDWIDESELWEAFYESGEDQDKSENHAEDVMQDFDEDDDGLLSFAEFKGVYELWAEEHEEGNLVRNIGKEEKEIEKEDKSEMKISSEGEEERGEGE